jgi:hypothetical protein
VPVTNRHVVALPAAWFVTSEIRMIGGGIAMDRCLRGNLIGA